MNCCTPYWPRLSDWNKRFWTPVVGWSITILTLVFSSSLMIVHTHHAHSLTAPPNVGGDSPIYDSLAWELSQGRGYVVSDMDIEFRQPYVAAGTDHGLNLSSGKNTDRPPLYPYVLSIGNRLFGRQFWFARLLQGLLLGVTAALVARETFRLAGPLPAILSAIMFTVVDWRIRWSSREILTESLACLLVMLLTLTLARRLRSRKIFGDVISGGLWGLLILGRTMSVLWWPVLLLVFYLEGGSKFRAQRLQGLLLISLCALVVCGPWWWRTCLVLGEFRPLGTQGAEQLSASYSDEAFSRLGMWFNLDQAGFFDGILERNDALEQARVRAEFSSAAARAWILAHPFKAALLWPLRLLQEFRPHGPGELFVLVFALLGMGLLAQDEFGRSARYVLLCQAFAIAATWSVAGRFVIPLLGPLHVCAAIGLWASYIMLIERGQETRRWLDLRHGENPHSAEAPNTPPV